MRVPHWLESLSFSHKARGAMAPQANKHSTTVAIRFALFHSRACCRIDHADFIASVFHKSNHPSENFAKSGLMRPTFGDLFWATSGIPNEYVTGRRAHSKPTALKKRKSDAQFQL
jgi:hypothetical protein